MQVGPATIISSCTPTVLIDGAAVSLACAATIKNTSHSKMFIDWQAVMPGPNGSATGQLQHKELSPGDEVKIPSPPGGQVWSMAFLTVSEVTHAAEYAAVLLGLAIGLMAYGGYEVFKHFVAPHLRGRTIQRLRG